MLRGFGAAALGAVVATSCRSQGSPTVPAGEAAALPFRLVAAFPTGIPYVPAGPAVRLPFQVARIDGSLVQDLPDPFELTIWRDDRQVGDPVRVRPETDGTSTYLPLPAVFDEAVDYEIRGNLEGTDLVAPVEVVPPDTVTTPPVGAPMPPSATATDERPLDVNPICTLNPQCPWHTVSLDAALGSRSPVALVIGSDVYCTDDRCGPSLQNFVAVAGEFPTVTSIHAEPFRNPKIETFPDDVNRTEVATALGVEWEPATFFVDRSGAIVGRADGIVGAGELRQLFAGIA